jgi:release factor glutamine methyltransferase
LSQPDSRDRSWTILEILQWTTGHLKERGIETARLDAEVLLAHSLGMSRLDLYLNYEKPLLPEERATFREYVKQRAQERIPVSLLIGEREFWSQSFKVTRDVLTPRPETELIVSSALDFMSDENRAYEVVDIGTGSGAIALSVASERPNAQVVATDVSVLALKVARANADQMQLNGRVRFEEGSLFGAVPGEQFDLVLSNPPYIAGSQRSSLARELTHEPELALFGGEDGYAVLRPLVEGVGSALKEGGLFLVELDPRQAETVAGWCRDAGLSGVRVLNDLAGNARVVSARKADPTSGAVDNDEKEHTHEHSS